MKIVRDRSDALTAGYSIPINTSLSGFPCRGFHCRQAFLPSQTDSIVALLAASARRTEHELTAHGLVPADMGRLVRLRPNQSPHQPDDAA